MHFNGMISVIIPVKNGSKTLPDCLSSLQKQVGIELIEILVLDSGSTDNSVAIAGQMGARVIPISPAEFNHGLTRNLGASLATGELLYFTVQDAAIAEKNMLNKMAAHFNDKEVQAVVGIQGIPEREDTNPALWFRRFTKPKVETRHYPNGRFKELTPEEQFQLSNWDDVNAMYRKTALQQIPFRETNFSEDWLWANEALKAGFKILRDPSLLVYHYHHMYFKYVFKTQFIINYYFYQFFNQKPCFPLLIKPIIQRTATLFFKRRTSFFKKSYWLMHNISAIAAGFISVLIFRFLELTFQNKGLDWGYRLFCKQIPQGVQKNK